MELEEFFILVDQTDKILFGALIFVNIMLWKKSINSCLFLTLSGVLIGLIFPFLSMGREIDRNEVINGPAMDSFEIFYTFMIFPVYWFVLFLQIIYILIKPNPKINKNIEDILDVE